MITVLQAAYRSKGRWRPGRYPFGLECRLLSQGDGQRVKAILRQVRGVIVFGGLTVNTVAWFTPLLALAIVKLVIPVARVRRGLTRVLMAIGENWVSMNAVILAGGGSKSWSAQVSDELRRDEWYLVIANHQAWVDIVILQTVLNRRIPFLKFLIKKELIWFPILGIAWWALDMPFMKRYSASYLADHPEKKGKDMEATRKACEKFRDSPTSVIIFIEGTRFSEQKRDARNSPYTHLLPPRAGGTAIAMSAMGNLFDALLDVTLVYPHEIPKFWDMCCGDYVRVIVDVQKRPIAHRLLSGDYENDREFRRELYRWLTRIWHEKDARMTSMKLQT